MKKIILSLLLVFSVFAVKAQSEFSVQLTGGMSNNSGAAAQSSTFLNTNGGDSHAGYANGAGSSYAANYGAALQWQYVFKFKMILGVQAGYEVVGTKTNIIGVYDGAQNETPATGYVIDHNNYININPFIGYRFEFNKVRFDVLPGFDIAIGVRDNETINVKASDNTYYNKRLNPEDAQANADFRARLGLAASYGKFGITASYARGLYGHNFDVLADGPVPAYYTNVFRLGISYRIK